MSHNNCSQSPSSYLKKQLKYNENITFYEKPKQKDIIHVTKVSVTLSVRVASSSSLYVSGLYQ